MTKPDNREEQIIETLSNCDDIPDARKYYKELIQLKNQSVQDSDKTALKQMFIAFGNEDRFLILDLLRQKDRCVCELEAILQKTQPAVSHHIKLLEQAQLIRGWKKGKFTHYSLIEEQFKRFSQLWTVWNQEITNWFGKVSLKK